ncbi:hypothetical protein IAU59_001233 [Kwoniella sp. CBS 9459]
MSGPLGNLPGMAYDSVRNRYFPIPKISAHNPNQTEEDTRPRPASASDPVYRPVGLNTTPNSPGYPAGPSRLPRPPASGYAPDLSSSSRSRGYQPQSQAQAQSSSRSGTHQGSNLAEINARWQNIRQQGNRDPRDVPDRVRPPQSSRTSGDDDRASAGRSRVPSRRNANFDRDTPTSNLTPGLRPGSRFGPALNATISPRMRSLDEVNIGTSQSGCVSSDAYDVILGQKVGAKRGRSREGDGQSVHPVAGGSDRVSRIRKGRLGVRYGGGAGLTEGDRHVKTQTAALSDLQLNQVHHACECRGEIITSYKSFGHDAYYATTDHGTMIIHSSVGRTSAFNVCAEKLVGVHCDVPRLVMMAIAGGPEPHLHLFKRDPEMLDHVFMTHSELDLKRAEIYGVSSFDDVCTIGSSKSISTISYSSYLGSKNRKLPSDALAVHQANRDLVFVGQRNGHVGLEDLRTPSTPSTAMQNVVAGTMNRKAIVGVKRLDDAAVPWGLVVSGMSHELMLFDIRFNARPLRQFEGHFSTFHTQMGMATSPDDKVLFAAGTDRRIRAWSTLSGDPILPPHPPSTSISGWPFIEAEAEAGKRRCIGGVWGDTEQEQKEEQAHDNPLSRVFESRITHLSVTEDMGLDVVHKGELMRFGRK